MTTKRYYRSRTDKVLSGVCGGLANYFNIDATLVRVAYAILTVVTGFVVGLVAYVVLALVAPEEPAPSTPGAPVPPT